MSVAPEDLQDTLKRLARRTVSEISREINENGHSSPAEEPQLQLDSEQRAVLVKAVADEMTKQGAITEDEAEILLQKLADQDEILNAAIDAFELGGEEKLSELGDSLRRVAKI